MVELPTNIVNKVEKIWADTAVRMIGEKRDAVLDSVDGTCTVSDLRDKVIDFNSTLNFIYKNNDEYRCMRFRMFTNGREVVLLQHPEIVSEIDKMFSVNGELYNLIDWKEEDVDFHGTGQEPEV